MQCSVQVVYLSHFLVYAITNENPLIIIVGTDSVCLTQNMMTFIRLERLFSEGTSNESAARNRTHQNIHANGLHKYEIMVYEINHSLLEYRK